MRILTFLALIGLAAALVFPVAASARLPPQDSHAQHSRQTQPSVPWNALDQDTQQMLAPLKPRWDRLPAHAQHHLLEKAKRWKRLPAYRQKRIRHNIQRWQQMTPAERQRVRTNERIYEQLSPRQREQLHDAYTRYKNMPPDQQRSLRRQWHHLSPTQRKHWIRNGAKGDLPHARSGGH